jgi:DNA-binding NtrC family response regulator
MSKLPAETPILVVDDSKAIRELMRMYLTRLRFTNLRFAATVKEALAAFEEQQSQVVFLDVLLGQEDGGEFARHALDERPLTTIVLMTALGPNDEEVVNLVAEGARHLLPKPMQLSVLRTVLDRIQEGKDEEAAVGEEPNVHTEDASYG